LNTAVTRVDHALDLGPAAISEVVPLDPRVLINPECVAPLSQMIAEDFTDCRVDLGYLRCATSGEVDDFFFASRVGGPAESLLVVLNSFRVSDFAPGLGATASVRGVIEQFDGDLHVVAPMRAGDIRVHGMNVGVPPATGNRLVAFRVLGNGSPRPLLGLSSTNGSVRGVRLEVFDVTGRKVAVSQQFELSPRETLVNLESIGSGWQRPGSYWCSAVSESGAAIARVIILR
jgi:hypothetical protein